MYSPLYAPAPIPPVPTPAMTSRPALEIAQIAKMFGWTAHLGHLTGGGTMANFEALWAARALRPGKAVAASAQAHYTHSRLSAVLNRSP